MSFTNKTEAELAAAKEANRGADVPPRFGFNKSWRVRVVEWKLTDGKEVSAMIPRGMAVHENLHAYYWKERESYQGMIAAAKKSSVTFGCFLLVTMDTQTIAGMGCIDPTDGPDDIAWLSCMFDEMSNWQMAFTLPDDCDIDLSSVKNAQHAGVRLP
jgi:hypothetical protein